MLTKEFIDSGNVLFRWRSYLPLFLFAAFFIVMYFNRTQYNNVSEVYEGVCFGIALLGEAIRAFTIGFAPDRTSGRNTKQQVADEINTTWIYSVIRHPLYLGNFLMWLGVAMLTRLPWAIAFFVMIYWVYYERIMMAEEAYLISKFGSAYEEYAKKTRCFLPICWKNWKKPNNRFNFKKVIRQEISSVYGLVCSFILLDLYVNVLGKNSYLPDLFWDYFFIFSTVLFLVLVYIKKKTRLLKDKM